MEIVPGLWGLLMIANLIVAIRLCYAIEERSGQKRSLQFANLIPVAFNVGVARDEETQRLRRRMNLHLLFVPLGFAAFVLFLQYSGVMDGGSA